MGILSRGPLDDSCLYEGGMLNSGIFCGVTTGGASSFLVFLAAIEDSWACVTDIIFSVFLCRLCCELYNKYA